MLMLRGTIDSVGQVRQRTEEQTGVVVAQKEVSRLMREELDMRYGKINRANVHINTQTNQVLRQQWAIRFIELSQ
jgi:hypothetical protein